jgi:hypothetical protein
MLISYWLQVRQIKAWVQQRTTSEGGKSCNGGTTFSIRTRLESNHDLISLFERDVFGKIDLLPKHSAGPQEKA